MDTAPIILPAASHSAVISALSPATSILLISMFQPDLFK